MLNAAHIFSNKKHGLQEKSPYRKKLFFGVDYVKIVVHNYILYTHDVLC